MTVFDRVGIPRHDWGRATHRISHMTQGGAVPAVRARPKGVRHGRLARTVPDCPAAGFHCAVPRRLAEGTFRRGAESLMVAGSRPRAASEGRRTDQTMTYAPKLSGADDLVRILIRNGVLRPARCWQSSLSAIDITNLARRLVLGIPLFCHSPPRRRRMRGSEMSAQMDAERTRP